MERREEEDNLRGNKACGISEDLLSSRTQLGEGRSPKGERASEERMALSPARE